VLENGYSGDIAVNTSLVNMYGKCGDLGQACTVLAQVHDKNRIAWNCAIQMLASNCHYEEAVSLFRRMQLEGLSPDASTCVSVLGACSSSSILLLEEGRRLHSISGFLDAAAADANADADVDVDADADADDVVVLQTAILAMYGRCEALGEAEKLFRSSMMLRGDVVSWCAIITACMQNGREEEALEYFGWMMHDAWGIYADAAIFVSTLDACARLSALDKGQTLHMAIIEQRHDGDVTIATALIAMYGRCGSVQDAEWVFFFFLRVPERCRNVVFWSAMIGAYAHSALENEAIDLLREMQERAIASNDVTLRSVLTACSYGGGITELIRSRAHQMMMMMMMMENGPREEEHSLSMVDLLGRMGRLDEAQDVADRVPEEKKAMAFSCLLGACRMHDDVERGARIAARLLELEPDNAASYVSLSNLYSSTSE
jgi:pentatricopeptide repeat protein